MNRNKAKGTKFESDIVGWLQYVFGTRDIERRTLNGAKDRGDVAGVKVHGQRLAIEVKSHARHDLAGWLNQANIEAANDDALGGVVVFKRRGTTDPAQQYVLCDLATLVALIRGERP